MKSRKSWISGIKNGADWIVENWKFALLIAGTTMAILSIIIFRRSYMSTNLSVLKKNIKQSKLAESIVMESANASLGKRKKVYRDIDRVFDSLLGG
jgi:hypothetical protein